MSQSSTVRPTLTKDRVVTFGCRLNAFEAEAIRTLTEGRDDLVVVNSCAVTAEAERQARQTIRKLRRERPDAEIIVTGCAAQINPAAYAALPEVDRVVGNQEKLRAETYGTGPKDRIQVNDIMSVKETANHLIAGFEERTRAFVQVQNGCDHRCTFCIIPFGRGNSRSVPIQDVIAQIRILVENNIREVVLCGVDITSYGSDLSGTPGLGQLVKRILKQVPELPRLRISSIDCIEIDRDLFQAIAEEDRLMPHLHLSLQSGDDMILKRMKRRHDRADAIQLTGQLREIRPEIVFGADLITGFPTETQRMFENTLRIVEECGLTWLHVFPYSQRPGTPAAKIPNQVPKSECKARAKYLRKVGKIAEAKYLDALVGQTVSVLLERGALGHGAVGHGAVGHSEGFATVQIAQNLSQGGEMQDLPEGEIVQAHVRENKNGVLIADLRKSAGGLI